MASDGHGPLVSDAERLLLELVGGMPAGEFAGVFRQGLAAQALMRVIAALPTDRRDQLIDRARHASQPPPAPGRRAAAVRRPQRPIATAIRAARQLAGLSQYQVAELVGVKQTSVSQWEWGHTVPSGLRMVRLLRALPDLGELLDMPAAQHPSGALRGG